MTVLRWVSLKMASHISLKVASRECAGLIEKFSTVWLRIGKKKKIVLEDVR